MCATVSRNIASPGSGIQQRVQYTDKTQLFE